MKQVSIVIPAYNEEKRIVKTIEALSNIKNLDKIIVINDGSLDRTFEEAKKTGALVIDLSENRGKGEAMNASLDYIKTDIIVFLDADLEETAAEAYKIIEPVLSGEADLCIATFPPPKKKGGFGLVKGTAQKMIYKIGQTKMQAPLSGQRAMTKEVLEAVTPFSSGYGVELGMTIEALLKGYRVKEVPTFMHHNETGRDLKGFWHRGKQLLHVLRVAYIVKRRQKN